MIARLSPHIFFSALLVALMLATPVAAKNKNNGGQQINAGLTALGAGPNTVAGPGYYEAGSDGNRSIYLVGEGLSPMDDVVNCQQWPVFIVVALRTSDGTL